MAVKTSEKKVKEVNGRILWTTPKDIRNAIKGCYLDYYGENISDECVRRIINYLKEIR